MTQKEIMKQLNDKEILGYISDKGISNWSDEEIPFNQISRLFDKNLIQYIPHDDIYVSKTGPYFQW